MAKTGKGFTTVVSRRLSAVHFMLYAKFKMLSRLRVLYSASSTPFNVDKSIYLMFQQQQRLYTSLLVFKSEEMIDR